MHQVFHDGVPGAYATQDGIPAGCVQLPVYQPYDNCNPQSDTVAAYFLIDEKYEAAVLAIPSHGVWRIQENASCTFATAWVRGLDSLSRVVKLHEVLWKLNVASRIPDGFRVVTYNRDWYDLRSTNICLLRKVTLEVQRARGLISQPDLRVSAS